MTAGNGLTVAYASYNKPTSITRGISTIGFSHDPEHQRFQQVAPGGTTLYLGNGSAYAEKFTGSDGSVRWSNYLVAAGGLVGMHVENSDETVLTRYFHKDHLGSIAVITNESGSVLERLSYDAWGKRRYADGSDDPAGAITSQTNRGFTGHEELDAVGLVHMNGRVYDPLLARFGTPDPTTESPFSTQGWNRYSYVGNSPLNFTDPSGYCFLGCFWQPIFAAIQNLFRSVPLIGSEHSPLIGVHPREFRAQNTWLFGNRTFSGRNRPGRPVFSIYPEFGRRKGPWPSFRFSTASPRRCVRISTPPRVNPCLGGGST
jgi:RHS repeat-associated protein